MRPATAGILWVLGGTFLFSLVFASGRLGDGTIPAIQIVFIRYVSGFAIVSLLLAGLRQGGAARRSKPSLHLLRALCGAGGGVCLIHASAVMPIADATAIGLTEGMVAMVLAVLLLHERVTPSHWAAAGLCAVGALIVVRVQATGDGGGSLVASGVALLGAVLIAGEIILIKVLAARDPPLVILWFVNGIAALLLAVPAWLVWQPMPTEILVAVALLGPLALAGQYCNIRGFRLADAALLAPVGYSWILFAGLIGWIGFGEIPAPASAIGAALIVVGGILLARLPKPRLDGARGPANGISQSGTVPSAACPERKDRA